MGHSESIADHMWLEGNSLPMTALQHRTIIMWLVGHCHVAREQQFAYDCFKTHSYYHVANGPQFAPDILITRNYNHFYLGYRII